MRYFHGIKLGGLQHKLFNLMLIFIVALIAVYVTSSMILQSKLNGIVSDTSVKQQDSITTVSEGTMDAVLETSMTKTTALQAYIADNLFSGLKTNVLTLRSVAEQLFANRTDYAPHAYAEPDAALDGTPTVQMLHEEGVDPAASADLSLIANMSELLLSIYKNSQFVSGCFVATTDGCLLAANDRSGSCVENGVPVSFAVRQRPWYVQAQNSAGLFFTGVELDARTQELCIECISPVRNGDTLVAVIGVDVFLSAVNDYVETTKSDSGFACIIGNEGQVLFSPRGHLQGQPLLGGGRPAPK